MLFLTSTLEFLLFALASAREEVRRQLIRNASRLQEWRSHQANPCRPSVVPCDSYNGFEGAAVSLWLKPVIGQPQQGPLQGSHYLPGHQRRQSLCCSGPSAVKLPAWRSQAGWLTHILNLTYSVFHSLNYFKFVLRKLGDCILNPRTFSLYAIAMVIFIFQLYVWVLMCYPRWWMQGWSRSISTFFINNTRDYFVSKIRRKSFGNDSNHNF